MIAIKGVTFDFYETLVRSRCGRGRGARFQAYLKERGLAADPWEHQVLYDVFKFFAEEYGNQKSSEKANGFWTEFTLRLFRRTNVRCSRLEAKVHSGAIRRIFGPEHFELYPEVQQVLERLNKPGISLALVSNWQKGLTHFCKAFGISDYFQTIIASAEVGIEKPNPRIFEIASARLGLAPESLLHVGDQPVDDIQGARAAGLQTVLLRRTDETTAPGVINDLSEILSLCFAPSS